MTDTLEQLLDDLRLNKILFSDFMSIFEQNYEHTPTAFSNGTIVNQATENQGSAKVFSFGQLNNLTKEDTLCLFGEHYDAVLNNPLGDDHQNIRQFMENGWQGISFHGQALRKKD